MTVVPPHSLGLKSDMQEFWALSVSLVLLFLPSCARKPAGSAKSKGITVVEGHPQAVSLPKEGGKRSDGPADLSVREKEGEASPGKAGKAVAFPSKPGHRSKSRPSTPRRSKAPASRARGYAFTSDPRFAKFKKEVLAGSIVLGTILWRQPRGVLGMGVVDIGVRVRRVVWEGIDAGLGNAQRRRFGPGLGDLLGFIHCPDPKQRKMHVGQTYMMPFRSKPSDNMSKLLPVGKTYWLGIEDVAHAHVIKIVGPPGPEK